MVTSISSVPIYDWKLGLNDTLLTLFLYKFCIIFKVRSLTTDESFEDVVLKNPDYKQSKSKYLSLFRLVGYSVKFHASDWCIQICLCQLELGRETDLSKHGK